MQKKNITLKFLSVIFLTATLIGCNEMKKPNIKTVTEKESVFYSIDEGNQTEVIFAPNYNKQWFEELDKKYSWEKFNTYDNRYVEYMYNLFDTLPVLAGAQTKSDGEFFNKLTRGQKVFYALLVFEGDTDNGGVYQFLFNRPEFSFAALEAFKELKLDTLARDYEKCLNEFIGTADSYAKRKELTNDPNINWKEKTKSFQEGYSDVKSAKQVEAYFYKDEFKKRYYKTIVDYIDKHIDQYVRK